MSRHCRSALWSLQRCVAARQLTCSGGSSRGRLLLQQPVWTWLSRAGCLHSLRASALQPAPTTSQRSFSSETTYDEEYPPLPFYKTDVETQKDEYIVKVKGLPWSCTAQDLLHFFSDCRIRDGVSGIHLTEVGQGRSSGEAFIEMEHEEDVRKALEKHRNFLGPRYVEVFDVSNEDTEMVLKKALGPPKDPKGAFVLWLRGLPFSSTEDNIKDFFHGLDIIEDKIVIVKDNMGRNKGTAFVSFSSQEAASEALLRNRNMMGNRYIEVFPSRSGIDQNRRVADTRQTNGLPVRSGSLTSTPTAPRPGSAPPVAALSSYPQQHFVHMRGLPFSVSGLDIVKFFAPLLALRIVLECGPNGRPSGEASVYFKSHQEATEAMSKEGMLIGERYIELFLNSTDGEEQ